MSHTHRHAHPKRAHKARGHAGRSFVAVAVGFVVLAFFYAGLRIEPALQFHRQPPVFFSGADFFLQSVSKPGGGLEYAAAFLGQLNAQNWPGAGVCALVAGAVLFISRWLLKRGVGVVATVAPFVAPFVLLWWMSRQEAMWLAAGVGVLMALGLAMVYLVVPWPQTWLRLVGCWVLTGVFGFVAGLWPGALVALIAALHEMKLRRQWLLGLGCGLAAPLLFLGLISCRDAVFAKVVNPWGGGAGFYLALALYLCLPLAMLLLPRLPVEETGAPRGTPSAAPARVAGRFDRYWPKLAALKPVAAGLLFIAGWGVVWHGLDARKQAEMRVDYHASRGESERAVAAARRLPVLDAVSEVRLHLALYHTGRLGDEFFTFTNQTVWMLMPAFIEGLETCRAQSETLFELGQVNMAEHYAHEALELEGERPEVLRLLARINVLKGRPQAARVFLNTLARIPFQREWAQETLRQMDADPRLTRDPLLAEVWARAPTNDLAHTSIPIEAALKQLLRTNPRNRMAYEYLMIHWLLELELDKFAEALEALDSYGIQQLPRHYEEAVLLQQRLRGSAGMDLRGRQIRPETRERFRRFLAGVNQRTFENVEGRKQFTRDFGDTYWHYYLVKLPSKKTPAPQAGRSP